MKFSITGFILMIGFFAYSQQGIDSNFHLYLLIGQSNMAGRGVLDNESKRDNTKILMLDAVNNWVLAKDPMHFDKPASAGVGPGIAFAKDMLRANNNLRIGLIPCAWGGSSIRVWKPGAKYFNAHPYDDALNRVRAAMKHGVLKGVLWHQGESDNDSIRSTKYMAALENMVLQLRKDLSRPELPFVAGEIGHFNKTNYINKVVVELPTKVSNTSLVTAEGLSDKGDELHFDSPSARELGRRYATAMLRLQATKQMNTSSKAPVVVLAFDDAEISHYTNVAPLLKQYGFNATFLVCEMARKPSDSIYYMNWSQIAALHRMGFEIGNHTGHHKNMTKLSVEEMKAEINYIEKKCKEYGISKPISFAYPGNRHDSLSQVVLKSMGYQFARTGGSRLFDPQKDPSLAIPSYTMGSTIKLSDRTWSVLKNLRPGQTLVFTIHGVPDIEHPDYTTSEKEFTAYLNYMKENNFNVVALRDLSIFLNNKLVSNK